MRSTYVDVENDLVLVETSLPSARVQELLEATGRLVLFRGLGGSAGLGMTMPAAVAIFRGGEVTGLARLVQVDEQHCVVEGTVDGLQPGLHQVRVLEYGDLSQGCARYGALVTVCLLLIASLVHSVSPYMHLPYTFELPLALTGLNTMCASSRMLEVHVSSYVYMTLYMCQYLNTVRLLINLTVFTSWYFV